MWQQLPWVGISCIFGCLLQTTNCTPYRLLRWPCPRAPTPWWGQAKTSSTSWPMSCCCMGLACKTEGGHGLEEYLTELFIMHFCPTCTSSISVLMSYMNSCPTCTPVLPVLMPYMYSCPTCNGRNNPQKIFFSSSKNTIFQAIFVGYYWFFHKQFVVKSCVFLRCVQCIKTLLLSYQN